MTERAAPRAKRTRRRGTQAATLLLIVLAPLAALRAAPVPLLDSVGFSPPAGASLPLDARFRDEDDRAVRLGDYVRARPAIVVPAYYDCSNLCGLVLRGLSASLGASGLRVGRDVDIVVFSISALDAPASALAKKRALLGGPSGAADGWHFLTGDDAAIGAVTNALGYRYAYQSAERQYAHAAGVAVVVPGGRIARVLYGVAFAPADLKRAVRAAAEPPSEGAPTVAGAARAWLLCFHYDPRTGRYSMAALDAVRAAALLALAALAAYVVRARRSERKPQGTPGR